MQSAQALVVEFIQLALAVSLNALASTVVDSRHARPSDNRVLHPAPGVQHIQPALAVSVAALAPTVWSAPRQLLISPIIVGVAQFRCLEVLLEQG